MKNLPIGLQTLSQLVEKDCIYVDKTKLIYQLISEGSYYFLARPRRFGKSLLVSTLAEIFAGNKKLFEGLTIDALPYDWKEHPVISISFSDIPCTSADELTQGIKLHLQKIAQKYDLRIDFDLAPGQILQRLVQDLSVKNHVALLIDEYDYPILKHIHEPETVTKMREILKNFYIVIKGFDPYLKFVFLTGVSKFSQTSIFSGLNNLNDISLDDSYNALLGYTHDEIVACFEPYLIAAADYNDCSVKDLLTRIGQWYDGYLFTSGSDATKLYNPYSVLLFLSKKRFSNYWFATGTPTF